MQRGTEMRGGGDRGVRRNPKNDPMQSGPGTESGIRETTPCKGDGTSDRAGSSRARTGSEIPRNNPMQRATALEIGGYQANPKNNPSPFSAGADEAEIRGITPALVDRPSNDPSSWTTKAMHNPKRSSRRERSRRVVAKTAKLTPCSRTQPLFSAFPHTKTCAADRLRARLGGAGNGELRGRFLVHPVARQPWPLGGRPCI